MTVVEIPAAEFGPLSDLIAHPARAIGKELKRKLGDRLAASVA
jgi:hypothetical protein